MHCQIQQLILTSAPAGSHRLTGRALRFICILLFGEQSSSDIMSAFKPTR